MLVKGNKNVSGGWWLELKEEIYVILKIIFLKSWNEWAEGNHLEPCEKWGKSYLEALL